MTRFLIDANLPFKVKVWQTDSFEFVTLIDNEMSDSVIWDYARERNLTIVTKDADFSHRIMTSIPPPKVIHIKIGNLRLKDFSEVVEKRWNSICEVSETRKLVNVFADRIEGIE